MSVKVADPLLGTITTVVHDLMKVPIFAKDALMEEIALLESACTPKGSKAGLSAPIILVDPEPVVGEIKPSLTKAGLTL